MRFRRVTHDENGNPRKDLPRLTEDNWITCCIQFIDPAWCSLQFIYDAHQKYDEHWQGDGFNYSIADILSGLSTLIRLGVVEARGD